MNTETIEYKGYKIKIAQDEGPENPFQVWDCEPPLLTYYGDRHEYFKSYKGPESIGDIVRLMPDACFERGQRVPLIKAMLNCSMREFAEIVRDYSSIRDSFAEACEEQVGRVPTGWRSAIEWFEMAESLLNWAGIPCKNTHSNGYSQGDSTLVLVILTPEWTEQAGTLPQYREAYMDATIELYSAWAWGDVYGVSEILDEQGNELEDGSCWGFYGTDHEKTGLLEHAKSVIDCHIAHQEKETANLVAAFTF